MADSEQPFWKTKPLEAMTADEWESLCDGCGRCCLVKLEDEDTSEIYLTRLACAMFDPAACRCSDYANRFSRMPDCVQITPQKARTLSWLPATCGYRIVAEGRDLAWWHPLVSGSPDTVHAAGISVRGAVRSEAGVKPENVQRYIVRDYPGATGPAKKSRRRLMTRSR